MHINLNKLKTGDKVAFSERVEKIVSHICRDNGETRSVGFRDGTMLIRDDPLWELAELPGSGVIWERSTIDEEYGYESLAHRDKSEHRFILHEDHEDDEFFLIEYLCFKSEQEAKNYANERVKQRRSGLAN
jgi:hypothetical protein